MSPSTIPTMALSILTMPIPGSKAAPKKFKGDFTEVKKFIKHYEKLCDYNQVTADKDRCETISQYTSRHVTEFIEGLDSYENSDWNALKADILKYYDADLDTKRYKRQDLVSYVKAMRGQRIPTLAAWKKYVRGFIRIAGWLQSAKKITKDEYAGYFWKGIYKSLRAKIESRLMAKDPDKDLSKAFAVDKVISAAEKLLHRDRFDSDLLISEEKNNFSSSDSEDSDSTESSLTSSEESSDSEEEEEIKPRKSTRKGSKKHYVAKETPRHKDRHSGTVTPMDSSKKVRGSKEATSMEPRDEIEDLIKQLNTMSLEDPQYALLYYRATKLDPRVMQIISPPPPRFGARMSPDSKVPRMNVNPSNGTGRGYGQGRPPVQPGSRFYQAPGTLYHNRICFACGEVGHTIPTCPKLAKLEAEGRVKRNERGQIQHPNGIAIRRMPEETVIEALKREEKIPVSHFVSVKPDKPNQEVLTSKVKRKTKARVYEDTSDEGEDEESDSDNDAFMIPAYGEEETDEEEYYVYPAERTIKTGVKARRERFDGVYPPVRKNNIDQEIGSKGKENVIGNKPMTAPRTKPAPMSKKEPVIKEKPKPLAKSGKGNEDMKKTQNEPAYDEENDDIIMEDVSFPKPVIAKEDKKKEETGENANSNPNQKVTRHRISDLAVRAKPEKVLESVLRTPVSLEVGEILGTSRELSGILANVIKPKPLITEKAQAHSIWSKTRGLLIKMTMYCDGEPISAIIDTGSQLNIVSRQVWKSQINRPIDVGRSISMNDANGGEGKLQGLVENVPLSCGAVQTKANLYVGDHVPFNLLLGRPWQRGNYVSIDERQDGTWLVFKDPRNLQVTHELLCTPDGISPEWVFEPSTWFGSKFPSTHLIFGDEMAIDNESELFNFDLSSLSTAENMGNFVANQNNDILVNLLGLHNQPSANPSNILEYNDIMSDVRVLDPQFEYIPTLYGIKEPRIWGMKDNPQYSPSKMLPLELPNLETQATGTQNFSEAVGTILGTSGNFRLSFNPQNNDEFLLHLHPLSNSTSPLVRATLPSPPFSPIQPADAETGWVEPFTTGNPPTPNLVYPDDAGVEGTAATEGSEVGLLGEGMSLNATEFTQRLTDILHYALENNATLQQILDASTIIPPVPQVPVPALQVQSHPSTPTSTPILGADPIVLPGHPALSAATFPSEPAAQVFSVFGATAQPPQVLSAPDLLYTATPTSTQSAATTVNNSLPFIPASTYFSTPPPSIEDWGPISTHPTYSPSPVPSIPQPYVESRVRTSVHSPSNELWADTRRVIHVSTITDNPSEPPFINRVRFLEAPANVPTNSPCPSEPYHYSPPPSYASHGSDVNAPDSTTILPVPNSHQYLLDYFATDLPTTTDCHTPALRDVTEAYKKYCKCQDNLCATDWDTATFTKHPFVNEVQEPFPSAGPRSERDWEDRVLDLIDHRLHSRALIAMLEDNISCRMLEEGLRRPGVLACDPNQRIGTHIPPTHYKAKHPPINPFFTFDETDYLNSLAAVAEFHGEHSLASSVEAALFMPYPDPDIIHAMVQEGVLEEQSECQIISFARDRDRALGIERVRVFIVAYHSFRSSNLSDVPQLRFCMCLDGDEFDEYSDSDDDEPGPDKSHIFFLA